MQPESMSSSDEGQTGEAESNIKEAYAERRKSSKPVMEKRRRARINSSLNELKAILLEALKKDSTRHSKLEKADILEMTVKYLKNVERQRLSVSLSIDPTVVDKFRAGFSECRNEVMRFLSTCEGVTVDVRTRLLSHLASCIHSIRTQSNPIDDNSFDPEPLASPFMVNGTTGNSPTQIRERGTGLNSFNPAVGFSTPSATNSQGAGSQLLPGFDAKLTVLHSATPQSNSVVLSKNVQLAQAPINGIGTGFGNITVFLPTTVAGTTFIAPLGTSATAASNNSGEQLQLQLSSPDSMSKKPRENDIVPYTVSNIACVQPTCRLDRQQAVVKPTTTQATGTNENVVQYQAAAIPAPSMHPSSRSGRDAWSSHKLNSSISSSEDTLGSDCERNSVTTTDRSLEGRGNRATDIEIANERFETLPSPMCNVFSEQNHFYHLSPQMPVHSSSTHAEQEHLLPTTESPKRPCEDDKDSLLPKRARSSEINTSSGFFYHPESELSQFPQTPFVSPIQNASDNYSHVVSPRLPAGCCKSGSNTPPTKKNRNERDLNNNNSALSSNEVSHTNHVRSKTTCPWRPWSQPAKTVN